ncbi:ABC multidrug transporter Mdr1 [Taphrina deformans PYCC 5710]|uniref:ABC multidrug transporter Mdr1 n=1 Tax=Taphrina deformans (strain PYCC 5710 / ATCC 11124 / CBS 356.35 / IMI 108563 / JCM 9778 / NBRC 8474) TaxID=1097556 RepID=R4X8A8_TAPDE|nr:ABC multidrug transporter Mdr1 [Taphrina deformans PYCC 5710]|eukprot:CCG81794.1 ABC multidrug transporter Mdr1 [Taphrina deformans PYCC 5710]
MAIFGRRSKRTADSLSEKADSSAVSRTASDVDGSVGTEDKTRRDGEADPLKDLEPAQREALLAQIDTPVTKDVTYFGLMRYATPYDRVLQLIGVVTCIAAGAALPLMTIVFGSLTQSFTDAARGQSLSQFQHDVNHLTLYFVYIAIGVFGTTYIYTTCFIIAGENITKQLRAAYLKAIMRQNVAYFDKLGAGAVTTRITSDTNLIQDGISQKIGLTLAAVATLFSAFIIAFIKNWKLTLILSSILPAMIGSTAVVGRFFERFTKQSLDLYSEGGTLAEEVISSIRVTQSFGTQEKLAKLFDKHLAASEQAGFKKSRTLGIMLGSIFFVMYSGYALAFWEGSRMLLRGEINTGTVINVFFAVIIGSFSLGQIGPNIQAFTSAISAGKKIFETIDRVPSIDVYSDAGIRLDNVKGDIELKHIKFIYPARPEQIVLYDMNLSIPAGKVTALVGASGSGKSTIVGLVERFYDPISGEVTIDGVPIRDINITSLRSHVSLVSQEPNLFATTVFENVAHGLIGTKYEDATVEVKREMVLKACTEANAAGFIETLPQGYDTHVGEKGMLLSGGQKQRVAIARAIISNPQILILDEATAALDTKSEVVVQDALDRASHNRTTIVIAHRLSTIKNAHNIVVMTKGRLIEQGTHNDLIEKEGAYYALVQAQRIAQAQKQSETSTEGESSEGTNLSKEKTEANRLELARTTTGQSISAKVLADRGSGDAKKEHGVWFLIRFVGSFNRNEWPVMLLGFVAAVLCGAVYPAQAVVYAKLITLFTNINNPHFQHDANLYALLFFIIAIVEFSAYFGTAYFFGRCSEMMIRRVRLLTFRSILRQDVAFFDRDENSTGALTSSLATQCTDLAGLHGNTLGTILTIFTNLASGAVLSLIVSWRLALVTISVMPVLVTAGYLRFKLLTVYQNRTKKAYEASANFACEATSVIRTVASLTREKDVYRIYEASLAGPQKAAFVSTLKTTVFFAASQSIVFLINGLAFWYGSTLIVSGRIGIYDFFLCFVAITFGAQSAGQFFSFAPDITKARTSAQNVVALVERKPEIDVWSNEGSQTGISEGLIEFDNVHFRYPTRPDVPVLRGLNLKVLPGQYVALVGASGCGKSTTIGLIERFYNPLSGRVTADGQDLTTINLEKYRRSMSLVAQEPTLYQGTIKFNVLLGANRDDVSQAELEQACRDANILEFIESLPAGFETMCGNRGTALSGGQKQRIAIARALIRNPKILLLDEATSALDSESEKVVQAALDKAAKGRTTIAVAHRLSTIQKADVIYVFDQGRIAESGTHHELVNAGGLYAELVLQQSLEKQQ